MAGTLPAFVDTVIVGNGPSALITSYILHGNIPVYDSATPHPDPLLHAKLRNTNDLLDLDIDQLTEHFPASRIPYSTQALPVNVLLDTLIRPNGETDDVENRTCIRWESRPNRAISHLVVGSAPSAGGQWIENPVKASWDIGTLSYANMLSLPGYPFGQHYQNKRGEPLPPYMRPSRRSVAEYLAAYPFQVGIEDTVYSGQRLSGISRTADGFHIGSHNLRCRHLILASGIFSELISPRPLLQPLLNLPFSPDHVYLEPLLVVGSGFSAADVIISTPPSQKIIHIFKWAPASSPSPLRACHQQAYPEYAGVYRRMKLAALAFEKSSYSRPRTRRQSSSFDVSRDWISNYEGFPNTAIIDVRMENETAVVTLRRESDPPIQRRISGLAYVIGRRGSLSYLDEPFRHEVCGENLGSTCMISGATMRNKAQEDLEMAPDVFITGSLTGDSLIRFAMGSCVYAAGKVINRSRASSASSPGSTSTKNGCNGNLKKEPISAKMASASPSIAAMDGLDGHAQNGLPELIIAQSVEEALDRRKFDG